MIIMNADQATLKPCARMKVMKAKATNAHGSPYMITFLPPIPGYPLSNEIYDFSVGWIPPSCSKRSRDLN